MGTTFATAVAAGLPSARGRNVVSEQYRQLVTLGDGGEQLCIVGVTAWGDQSAG
ncbi:hypothetical protein ACT3TQ_10860 [Halomonas sp. AOP12-C2-37]|uniref:hypothetical protein n=1 Tax=unclassified Halomonas TaxID=2609666 RepID=UPI004033F303